MNGWLGKAGQAKRRGASLKQSCARHTCVCEWMIITLSL